MSAISLPTIPQWEGIHYKTNSLFCAVRFLISFLQSSMSLQMGELVKFVIADIAAWESHKMATFENVDDWYDSCFKSL